MVIRLTFPQPCWCEYSCLLPQGDYFFPAGLDCVPYFSYITKTAFTKIVTLFDLRHPVTIAGTDFISPDKLIFSFSTFEGCKMEYFIVWYFFKKIKQTYQQVDVLYLTFWASRRLITSKRAFKFFPPFRGGGRKGGALMCPRCYLIGVWPWPKNAWPNMFCRFIRACFWGYLKKATAPALPGLIS